MKKIFKKNQVIITSLAIMIAIAGYLNFTADKTKTVSGGADGEAVVSNDVVSAGSTEDTSAMADISEEDILNEQQTGEVAAFPEEDAQDVAAADTVLTDTDNNSESVGEGVGEAVLTSSAASNFSAAAKLNREQTRSKNKEALLEIINNTEISESMKQEAIDSMVGLTEASEKELAAETLLEARGFASAVVSITEDTADVVIGASAITDAQRAQIEDIVTRKTEIGIANIVITTLSD